MFDGGEVPKDSRDQKRSRSNSVSLVDVTVCRKLTRVLEDEEQGNGPERRYPSFDATAVGP